MALCKTGTGIIDIKGSVGGVYFHRDRSGLHVCRQPRSIHHRSSAQDRQRKAFIQARSYCTCYLTPDKPKDWLNRCVSFNIYRSLNALSLQPPPADYQIPTL